MIAISRETEALALRLAAAQHMSADAAIRQALERRARAAGVEPEARRRRMSVEQMLALGSEIAAMPLLDPRSPAGGADNLSPSSQ
jgi:hypothetical protein